MMESLKRNISLIAGISLSLLISLGYFILIDYGLKQGMLESRTSTWGYIGMSIVIGFSTVWLAYKIYSYINRHKKVKVIKEEEKPYQGF